MVSVEHEFHLDAQTEESATTSGFVAKPRASHLPEPKIFRVAITPDLLVGISRESWEMAYEPISSLSKKPKKNATNHRSNLTQNPNRNHPNLFCGTSARAFDAPHSSFL